MNPQEPQRWREESPLGIMREHYSTKAELERLRTELHKMENRILKWVWGQALVVAGLIVGGAWAIVRLTST